GETLTTGTKIFVKLLKHNMDRTLTALGFDADFDDGTTQTFTYDSQAIEVTMKAAAVNFTAKSEAYERDIDIVDDDHSAVSTYALNNGTYTPKTTAVYGDTVYVKVDIADSDYALKSLVLTYNTATYPSRAMSVEIYGKDHLSGPTNGYYSFVMPDIADEENLTLTCVTKNVSTYRGADFVGTYQGVSLFNSAALSSVNVFSPQIKTVIDGSGELITGIGSSSASLLNIVSASDGFACTSTTSNAGFAYDDKVIYTSNSTFSMAQNVPGNNGYAYLKVAPGTLESDYAVHAELFSSNGHTYQVYQFLYQGNAYSGIFVDSLGTYHLGVTFEMITGTNVNDANATYHIKENGVEIAYVDIKDSAGGQENRVIRDAYFGAYNCTDTEEWRVLVLDGLGHATYGDKTLSYTVDANGQVTATHLNVTLVANLDTTAMTYEIVSYEEIDNVLYGKKFTAVITDDRDPEWISTYYFHLNFKELANYEPRITTAASGGALMWPYSEAKVTELYPDCIYSYEGSTVTCAFFQRDTNAPITMILAMNDAGNPTKLTVTSMSATFDRTGCYPIVVGTEFNLA
ncbi:MAG: hypothetical protein HUJ60_04555, partial [Bacilli bacterium]|nr:hypothetical protein [Bacilli bacterium]